MREDHRYFRYFNYIQPVLKIPIVKTYGAPILTIFVLTIFILFAIKPTIETIIILQKKLEDNQAVLAQITQKSKDLSQAKKNYQALDTTTKQKIQTAIPDQINLRTITQTLEGLAITNNASISAIQVQPITLQPTQQTNNLSKLEEVTFTYNVEGRYGNLVNILSALQQSSRLIRVDSLIMNKLEGGSNLLMSITGKAYYLK